MENCLFHVLAAKFQPPDKVKNYITSTFQAFYQEVVRNSIRRSHAKAFIYLKPLKIIYEEINL